MDRREGLLTNHVESPVPRAATGAPKIWKGVEMFIRPKSNGKFEVVEKIDDQNELVLRTLDSYNEAEGWIEKAKGRN